MTYSSSAFYSNITYSTRLKNQGIASMLINSPGQVLIDLRMLFFVFYDPGNLGVGGYFMRIQ